MWNKLDSVNRTSNIATSIFSIFPPFSYSLYNIRILWASDVRIFRPILLNCVSFSPALLMSCQKRQLCIFSLGFELWYLFRTIPQGSGELSWFFVRQMQAYACAGKALSPWVGFTTQVRKLFSNLNYNSKLRQSESDWKWSNYLSCNFDCESNFDMGNVPRKIHAESKPQREDLVQRPPRELVPQMRNLHCKSVTRPKINPATDFPINIRAKRWHVTLITLLYGPLWIATYGGRHGDFKNVFSTVRDTKSCLDIATGSDEQIEISSSERLLFSKLHDAQLPSGSEKKHQQNAQKLKPQYLIHLPHHLFQLVVIIVLS